MRRAAGMRPAGGQATAAVPLAFAGVLAFGAIGPGERVFGQDPLLADYEHLLEPRIVELENLKVIQVTATGDPDAVGPPAFGLVYQLYFSAPGIVMGPDFPAPRARWQASLDAPRAEWVGRYALPVPAEIASLPAHEPGAGLESALVEWEYGEVAEILHVGPYEEETPTVERLHAHIESSGYVTVGGHEEEYVRGPTMQGPGDPERYLTIIRYRVKRR